MPLLPRAVRSIRLTRTARRTLGYVAVAVGLLLASLLLVSIGQLGRVLPGTRVLGVEIGGRDVAAAERLLAPVVARFEHRPLAVRVPGRRLLIDADDVGLSVDVASTLDDAFARGRRGPLGPAGRLIAPLVVSDVHPHVTLDEALLAAWVERAATELERSAHAGDLLLDATARRAHVVGPQGSLQVDREASIARLRAALTDPTVRHVTLATTTTLPPASRSAIEALAANVDRALRRALVLEHDGRRLTVDASMLARMLTVRTSTDGVRATPTIVLPVDRVEEVLGAAGDRIFARSPVDARLDIPDTDVTHDALGSTSFRPVPVDATVTGSVDRTVLVPRRTAVQLARMLTEGITRAEADLLTVAPGLTTADAVERLPTHVIGTFTTRFAAGGARTVNIALLADLIDGSFVAPGDEFSINRTSGPRSCTAGFLEAGTIVLGELVDTCGGGVSQLGTTVLNAAFFAGVPLTHWQPHSFFISRYPAGREATLSYPELDVRFRNDTDGWIVLRASTTATSVTVTLLGRPRWAEVRAEHGAWSTPTPFTEVVRTAPDLGPGTRRVVQAGGDGFSLTVSRTRVPEAGGDAPEVERWRTVYRPQQRIVEISPADAPADAGPPVADGAASGG